jgi:hypothetical protein
MYDTPFPNANRNKCPSQLQVTKNNALLRRQNLTRSNTHLLHRPIGPPRLNATQPLHNIHTINHMSENRVSAVQMPRRSQGNEKLAAVRVRTGIGHAQHSRSRVGELGNDFVGEFGAVN